MLGADVVPDDGSASNDVLLAVGHERLAAGPLLDAEAIEGVEWVIDMLLRIVRSSIRSPAA